MVMPRHGPQALPPGFAAAAAAAAAAVASKQTAPQKKKKRRRRHWDEQDDGVDADVSYADGTDPSNTGNSNGNDDSNVAKKRRVSRQQAVAIGLSYDDEAAGNGGLSYEEEGEEVEYEEEEEGEASDDDASDDKDERDYTLEHRDLYESSVGDARGYYHDGAYVAAPVEEDDIAAQASTHTNGNGRSAVTEQSEGDAGADVDPEAESARFSTAYRSRLLLTHFAQLRAIVRPPSSAHTDPGQLADAVAALPPDHDTDVGPLSTRSGVFRRWLYLLRTTDPLPAQIAAMDKVSVLRLLRVLLRGLLVGGSTSSRSSRAGRFEQKLVGGQGNGGLDMNGRTGRWLWALFARLPDRGELDYREVGYIRDVAKQAVMRLAHLSYDMAGTDVQGDDDLGEEEEEEGEELIAQEDGGEVAEPNQGEPLSVENVNKADEDQGGPDDMPMDMESEPETGEAKETGQDGVTGEGEKPQEAAEDGKADQEGEDGEMQQRATLEMVLAVAGEFYGQRDLLAFRTPWPAASLA